MARLAICWLLVALAPAAAAQALAGDSSPQPLRWYVEGGSTTGAKSARAGLILERADAWRLGPVALSAYGEFSLGRWQVDRSRRDGRSGFTQVGLTPVVRLWGREPKGWFGEAGIGLNLIEPRYRTTEKRFSTAFNFGDHVGVGWRSASANGWEASLRYQHFSNASIKQPNPGEEFVQLRVGAAF